MTRTIAAEVVFIEHPGGKHWTARLLAPDRATGMILNRPVAQRSTATILTIREVQVTKRWPGEPSVHYDWTTPGATHPGGNRHHQAYSLSEAQARVTAWAARRFRTEVPS